MWCRAFLNKFSFENHSFLIKFCKDTNLHGFKHIVKKEYSAVERFSVDIDIFVHDEYNFHFVVESDG